ncbi:MAG: hypothetical protein U0R44_06290 [Candidatus Micrarchaeia archaeon]
MALLDRLLLRGPDEISRAEAMREFKRLMPKRGRFGEMQESGITGYYDKRFGLFEPSLDRWEDGHADVLKANPQLRRIDALTDALFQAGRFELRMAGHIISEGSPPRYEGTVAAISVADRAGLMKGMLTLDIGGEVRFSKLRIGTHRGSDFLIRLSALDHGMALGPNRPVPGRIPETIHERAAEGSEVFQTLAETLAGIERILRGKAL